MIIEIGENLAGTISVPIILFLFGYFIYKLIKFIGTGK